ncbi:hypothetical protein JHK82_023981 [Glycine max]|nr:hypothetical protein JHK87_023935 [Glycine soja]KAG5006002.1 hypothetical protein JHK85_024544 [Glycine max]KAG5011794.1 hypothetical protein JHK86_024055 [Glycine max]KAG5132793.1 hypothetical protein JHK82_023981 [Glycine max]KAH1041422.1 hypothetical protein GYH30_023995 [Glycine max]
MSPKASPSASLIKIGSDGFDLIERHYGRFRRNQVPPFEVPIIVNSNNPGASFGGANIDNKENPKPPRRNWAGRSLVSLSSIN